MRHNFGDNLTSGEDAAGGDCISLNPAHHTPDHPPYSEMVQTALRALGEEGGSTESSISAFIRSSHANLPWGHDRLLPYYLRRLVNAGELISPFPGRYKLQFVSPPPRSWGRPFPQRSNLCSAPSYLSVARGNGRAPRRRGRGRPPLSEARSPFPFNSGRGRKPHSLRGRGRPPLRSRGRGRPSLRRERLKPLGYRRSGHTMPSQDVFMAGNAEGWYCLKGQDRQSAVFAFCGDGVLVDPEHSELDLGHRPSSQVKGSTMIGHELCEYVDEKSSSVNWAAYITDEIPEPGWAQCSLDRRLTSVVDEQSTELRHEQSWQVKEPNLMVDEQSELDHGLPLSKETTLTVQEHPGFGDEQFLLINGQTNFVAREQCDRSIAQCSAIKGPSFLIHEELSQLGEGSLVTSELGFEESLPLVVSEVPGRGTGESFDVKEQALGATVSFGHGPGNLLTELHEQGEQVQWATPKDSMNCEGKLSPVKGPSWVAVEEAEHGKELSLLALTDVQGVEKEKGSRTGKRRKSRAKQRRLWFEGT